MFIESNIKEDIDSKNEFRIKNLPDLIRIGGAISKKYVDIMFNDPNLKTKTAHVDFEDRYQDSVRFMKINSYPAKYEHTTAKSSVDQSIEEPVLVREFKSNEFSNSFLSNM